jgi:hypothetical protein
MDHSRTGRHLLSATLESLPPKLWTVPDPEAGKPLTFSVKTTLGTMTVGEFSPSF